MRIAFRKLTDERHVLTIVRDDGAREAVECETRSYLTHDLLHYAVESEVGLAGGFWGTLAAGATLARVNDRTQPPPTAAPEELAVIEQIVGALSGTLKGRRAASSRLDRSGGQDTVESGIAGDMSAAFAGALI